MFKIYSSCKSILTNTTEINISSTTHTTMHDGSVSGMLRTSLRSFINFIKSIFKNQKVFFKNTKQKY